MHETQKSTRSCTKLAELSEPAAQHELQGDAELLDLYIATGDRTAIEALIVRYTPMVASVCALTVADKSSAEDAFQATFLILLRQAKKIRRRASLAAWLHGVAYRCACRLRKRQRERPLSAQSEEVIAMNEETTDPLCELARKLNLDALDRELENLPQHLREPLIEHYLLGNTTPQIAERMDMSVSAVEGRLRRGRRTLRTRLARRGISLSVLAVGSGLFQEHLAAAKDGQWVNEFLSTYLSEGPGTTANQGQASGPSSQVSSLVRGETAMFGTHSLTTAVVSSTLLVGGALIAFSAVAADGGRETEASGSGTQLTISGTSNQNSVVAQLGPQLAAPSPASPADINPTADQPVPWQRPESSEGSQPNWLEGGRTSMEAIEANRQVLSKKIDFKFENTPLSEVVDWLTQETGTPFVLNATEIELGGLADVDTPVTINFPPGTATVREIIRLVGDPLELTYKVNESCIELTTKDHADEEPNMRFYDLSYILPNSANVPALLNAIQLSVTPLDWDTSGGQSTLSVVGSMMIVSAPDAAHQKIEVLLLNISRMNPRNVEQASELGPTLGAGVGQDSRTFSGGAFSGGASSGGMF